MLHTVNKSPFEKNSLQTCLRLAKSGNDILLIEDAVYAAMKDTSVADTVSAAVNRFNMYVLEPDLKSRGVAEHELLEGIGVVDYAGFVRLATENDKVQSWL